MPRITKAPEERRNELMDAAQDLFLSKGYEKTTVSDIVKCVNVAQGTFYYHFGSKADILDAVVDRFISALEAELQNVLGDTGIDAVQKVNDAINRLVAMTEHNREIIEYLHQPSNAILHDRIVSVTMDRLVPLFARTVEEGSAAGQFSVSFPFETMEMIMAAIFWKFHRPDVAGDEKQGLRIRKSLEQILDRVLGVEPGSFQLNF